MTAVRTAADWVRSVAETAALICLGTFAEMLTRRVTRRRYR
jgi:hypothetical protein